MADQNKTDQAAEGIKEGAKPEDTVAETAKPDTDAKSLKDADAKKASQPIAKTGVAARTAAGTNSGNAADTNAGTAAAATKKAATAKKEKPPKPEEKPFSEFMEQHYLPSLKAAMAKEGIDELDVEFAKRKLEVMGQSDGEFYWQVQGEWKEPGEGQRQFNIAFMAEDITAQKVFTLATNGATPSTVEQFMGDERRITLDLMVLYTLQRLNGQKWLTRN